MSNYGNKQKHESKNPAQRALLNRFKQAAVQLVDRVAPKTVLEVGCGEGYMLDVLAEARPSLELTGIDISQEAVADASARLGDRATVRVEDARDLSASGESYDLVVMLEVLEHIPNPAQMLPVLEGLTKGPLLLSVPWEPFFRGLNFMRGKHLTAWGNDPEHVNHWGRRSFLEFVGSRFEVLETPVVFPWTMVLAKLPVAPKPPAARRVLSALARLVLGGLLLAGLLYFLGPDWGEVRDNFEFHPAYFGLGFLGTVLATAFTAARWRLLNEQMTETRLPYGSYFHYIAVTRFFGQFISMWLMEFVGRGMGLRAAGSKQGLGRLVTPVLLERVLDAALPCTTLAWLFLVLHGPASFAEHRWLWLVAITVGFAIAAIPFIGPTANILLRLYAWVKKLRGHPLVLEPVEVTTQTSAWVALHSVGRYATVLLQFIGMGAAAGAVLTTFSVWGSFSVAQLAALLAVTPGGLGIQDVGWGGALQWLGAETVMIALFVFGFRASMILNFGLLSLLTLPLRKAKA